MGEGGLRIALREILRDFRITAQLPLLVVQRRDRQPAACSAKCGQGATAAQRQDARARLREIDRRIRYLSKLLDRLTVVQPNPAQEGCVFFGATVIIAFTWFALAIAGRVLAPRVWAAAAARVPRLCRGGDQPQPPLRPGGEGRRAAVRRPGRAVGVDPGPDVRAEGVAHGRGGRRRSGGPPR